MFTTYRNARRATALSFVTATISFAAAAADAPAAQTGDPAPAAWLAAEMAAATTDAPLAELDAAIYSSALNRAKPARYRQVTRAITRGRRALRRGWRGAVSQRGYLLRVINAYRTIPGGAPVVASAREVARTMGAAGEPDPLEAVVVGRGEPEFASLAGDPLGTQLEAALRHARAPAYARAWNQAVGTRVAIDIRQPVQRRIASSATLRAVAAQTGATDTGRLPAPATLAPPLVVDGKQLVEAATAVAALPPSTPRDERLKRLDSLREDLDRIRAKSALIGKVLKRVDPEFASALQTCLEMQLKIGLALIDFAAKGGGWKLVESIGSAFSPIERLLGGSPLGGDPVGDGLRQLSKQIEALTAQMNSRFDQIDRKLDDVLATLNAGFTALAIATRDVDLRVQALQETVFEMRDDVNRMEANLLESLQAGDREEFWDDVEYILHWRERNSRLSQLRWDRYLTRFATRAFHYASSQRALAPRAKPITDDGMLRHLREPFDDDLNYLSRYVASLDRNAAIAPRHAANAVDWAISARAYAVLLEQWPELGRHASRRQFERVRSTGRTLQASLRRIAAKETGIWTALLKRYRDRVADLGAALEAVENDFVATRKIDPFAGPSQQPPRVVVAPQLNPLKRCDGQTTFALKSDATRLSADVFGGHRVDDSRILLAEHLVPGLVDFCFSSRLVPSGFNLEYLHVTLFARYGTPKLRQTRGPIVFERREWQSPTPQNQLIKDPYMWTFYREAEIISALAQRPAAVDNRVPAGQEALIDARIGMRARMIELYHEQIGRLASGSTRPDAERVAGVRTVAGAVAALGLPQTLQRDDELTQLLTGSPGLLDDQEGAIRAIYHSAIDRLTINRPSREQLPEDRNARFTIVETAKQRADALEQELGGALAAIKSGKIPEGQVLVNDTLEMLQAAWASTHRR